MGLCQCRQPHAWVSPDSFYRPQEVPSKVRWGPQEGRQLGKEEGQEGNVEWHIEESSKILHRQSEIGFITFSLIVRSRGLFVYVIPYR